LGEFAVQREGTRRVIRVNVTRIVLVGNRQFAVGVVGFSGSEAGAAVARFIDSFVVLNVRGGADGGITGRVRDSFVTNAIQSCLKKQNNSPENAGLSAETITRYCVCYANGLANVTTNDELRNSPTDGSVTAAMQKRPSNRTGLDRRAPAPIGSN
jgi:hypothetical protein